MSYMDSEYVTMDGCQAQQFVADTDEDFVVGASSSSYEYTEGDMNSPYIVPSSLR
jgi:hypothetical protein